MEQEKQNLPAEDLVIESALVGESSRRGLSAAWWPLLLAFIFGLAYLSVYIIVEPVTVGIKNAKISRVFESYGAFFGWGFAGLSLLFSYVLFGVTKLFRRVGQLILWPLLSLAYWPWLALGWQLLYREPRYTDLARAIIDHAGRPLYFAAMVAVAVCLVGEAVYLVRQRKNKHQSI